MAKKQIIAALILILVVAGAGYWFFMRAPEPEAPPAPVARIEAPVVAAKPAPAPEPPPPPSKPVIKHPLNLPAADPAHPLPTLDASDAVVQEALAELLGVKPFARFFHVRSLVRRIVLTIDHLPQTDLSQSMLPLNPPAGAFRVAGKGQSLSIAPQNAARYTPYVRLAEGVNSAKLIDAYLRLYPLFQTAYEELDHSGGYFNDRLVEVIDHLLTAQSAAPPLRLTPPSPLYGFADPKLESRSSGHKMLLRAGQDNTAHTLARLRDWRKRIATEPGDADKAPATLR